MSSVYANRSAEPVKRYIFGNTIVFVLETQRHADIVSSSARWYVFILQFRLVDVIGLCKPICWTCKKVCVWKHNCICAWNTKARLPDLAVQWKHVSAVACLLYSIELCDVTGKNSEGSSRGLIEVLPHLSGATEEDDKKLRSGGSVGVPA